MMRIIQTGDNPVWTQNPINGIEQTLGIPYIHAFAFNDGGENSVVIFNLHMSETQTIALELETRPNQNGEFLLLSADNLNQNNEDAELVTVQSQPISDLSETYSFDVPKHSMAVLKWRNFPHQVFIPIISAGSVSP